MNLRVHWFIFQVLANVAIIGFVSCVFDVLIHRTRLQLIRQVLQLSSYFSQLLRCTPIQGGSMTDPNDGTLTHVVIRVALLFNANNAGRTIPACMIPTSRTFALSIEINKLTNLKQFNSTGFAFFRSENATV